MEVRVAAAYFKAFSKHLLGENEEGNETSQSRQLTFGTKTEPGVSKREAAMLTAQSRQSNFPISTTHIVPRFYCQSNILELYHNLYSTFIPYGKSRHHNAVCVRARLVCVCLSA
jgi:hypothetical protein